MDYLILEKLENSKSIFHRYASNVLSALRWSVTKTNRFAGITKFLDMLPPTISANMKLLIAMTHWMKNPFDTEAGSKMLSQMQEALKLSLMSGALIPVAGMIPGVGVPAMFLTKALSYGYFYIYNWAQAYQGDPKYGDFAKKLMKLMPEKFKNKESEAEEGPFSNWLNRRIA